MESSKYYSQYFTAAALFTAIVAFFYPLQIYFGNPADFPQDFKLILPGILIMFLFLTAVISAFGFLFTTAMRINATLLLLALSYVIIITGQILVLREDILFDGSTLVFKYSAVDVLVSALAIAVPLFLLLFFKGICKHRVWLLSGIALLWSIVSLFGAFLSHPRASSSEGQSSTTDFPVYSLSEKENIIHVMFDSLQADILAKIITSDLERKKRFKGFELFLDHAGCSNWTSTSFISILTGRNFYSEPFDTRDPYKTAKAKYGDNFLKELEKNNFETVFLGPSLSFCEALNIVYCGQVDLVLSPEKEEGRFMVGLLVGSPMEINETHAELLDLSLFRIAPIFLKKYVYNNGKFFFRPVLCRLTEKISDSAALKKTEAALRDFPRHLSSVKKVFNSKGIFEKFIHELNLASAEKKYLFIHVYPPHRPFIFSSECEMVPISSDQINERIGDFDPDRYEAQARCALKLFEMLLARLKDLGVYETSAIILQSDTGLGIESTKLKNVDKWKGFTTKLKGYSPGQFVAYANPALMIKKPNASQQFKMVKKPTSHDNTFNSILEMAGIAKRPDLPNSFWEIPVEDRERSFVVTQRHVGPGVKVNALNTYEEFSVKGPLRDLANWHNLGVFQGFKKPYVQPNALRELVVDVRKTTGADQLPVTLIRANAIGNSDAEYMFTLRTVGEHPNSRMLKKYSPSNTLRLGADEIGSGIDLYVYARSVGSVSRYDVQKKIRLVP